MATYRPQASAPDVSEVGGGGTNGRPVVTITRSYSWREKSRFASVAPSTARDDSSAAAALLRHHKRLRRLHTLRALAIEIRSDPACNGGRRRSDAAPRSGPSTNWTARPRLTEVPRPDEHVGAAERWPPFPAVASVCTPQLLAGCALSSGRDLDDKAVTSRRSQAAQCITGLAAISRDVMSHRANRDTCLWRRASTATPLFAGAISRVGGLGRAPSPVSVNQE